MKVYTVMLHTDISDTIIAVLSSEKLAKKRAEHYAAVMYPANKYRWVGHFLTCEDRYEEWSVQEWTVRDNTSYSSL